MKLTEEQKSVILSLLQFNKPIQILAGLAGTGKTTIISHLYKAIDDVAVCAYTGKAASVLRSKGVPATTIHRLIYIPLKDEYGKLIYDKHGNPIFVKADSIDADAIIVDEASMISKDIYEDLLSFKVPIIFVGDHGQLEPIGENINLMANPDFKLEQIHRNAGEIAHFCHWIRSGFRPAAFAQYAKQGKVIIISKYKIPQYYTKVDQIICAFNKTRVAVNYECRRALGFQTDDIEVGDKVMCLKNNYKFGLYNGMQGRIAKIHGKIIRFVTEEDTFNIPIDKSQFGRETYDFEGIGMDDPAPFDWANCITVHKAQGSEWGSVMVLEQRTNKWDFVRHAYTAASRAQHTIIWAI